MKIVTRYFDHLNSQPKNLLTSVFISGDETYLV